jgi:ribosome-associated protein
MDIRKLQRAIVDGLEDVKAQNIVVFNTEHLSPLFERVIVASGTSNRQTKALASSVRETVKARGLPILSVEGADNGEWVIVDCGAAVAHIMQPAIRDYYRLEEIWGGKSVRMKIDDVDARPRRHDDVAVPPPAVRARSRTGASKPPPRPAESRAARNEKSTRQTASAASTRKKPTPARKTGGRSR